jgi:VWFA-related protein
MRRKYASSLGLSLLLCAIPAPGQGPAAPPKPGAGVPTIRTTVQVVIAPTTVVDSRGKIVNGLKPHEFRLLDNDKVQEIREDIGFQPLSMVIAIQANYDVENVLPKVKKIGPILHDVVAGQDGEVALIGFDHRIQLLQDFTSDTDKLVAGLDKLRLGSSSSRLIDATQEAVRMLRNKKDRRKVILLISQTRDMASSGGIREVATELQLYNIDVYSANISSLVARLTTKPAYPRPDHLPPGARPMPGAAAKDPISVAQTVGAPGYAADTFPVFEEVFRGIKGLFWANPAEAFTKLTGGREFKFVSQQALERVLMDIGEDLHSQYLLSYTPNNMLEGGFHKIRVEVMRPGLKVRTRPGYWMAARPE